MTKTQAWIKSFRPRTLPLAVSGMIMGNGLGAALHMFNPWICALSILTAVLLQILSNLANDYGDFQHGADTEERMGELRGMQHGLITATEMKRMLFVFAGLSLVSGLALLLYTFSGAGLQFLLFLLLGLAAIGAAIKYTVGRNPYGYAGLGEVSVFLFFGLLAVLGSFFLQYQHFRLSGGWMLGIPLPDFSFMKLANIPLLMAISVGCWSAGVLNINNIRDMRTDEKAGKRTLALRLGLKGARIFQSVLILGGILSFCLFNLLYKFHIVQWLGLLPALLLLINLKEVWTKEPSPEYNKLLKQLSLSTLLFVLVFIASQIYAFSYIFRLPLSAPALG